MPNRLATRSHADELMDDPALDTATYHAVLADLARVNRLTFAYRPTLDFLRRAVGKRSRFTLLDVGFGDGDMLRAIARWADVSNLLRRFIVKGGAQKMVLVFAHFVN